MKIEFHKDPLSFLGANPWFSRLPAESRRTLLEAARRTALSKGRLYGEEDPVLGLCAVLSGSLRIEIAAGSGRPVLFDIAGPGAILLLPSGFDGRAQPLRIRAAEKTVMLGLDALRLEDLSSADPGLANALQCLAQIQLNHLLQVTAAALNLAPRAKLASRLASAAERRIDDKKFANLTQGELGEMTGLSRKSVHGHLRALEALAIIEVVYGGVRILDRPRLLAVAAEE